MKIFHIPYIYMSTRYIHNLHVTSTTVSFTTGLIIPTVMKLSSTLDPTNES